MTDVDSRTVVLLWVAVFIVGMGFAFILHKIFSFPNMPCTAYQRAVSGLSSDIRVCKSNACVDWYIAQEQKLKQDCANYSPPKE